MKIFILEDNKQIIKALRISFGRYDAQLTACGSLEEARKVIEAGGDFDVAVLDVILPDGDGFTFFDKVLRPRGIPALFLTARDEEEDILKGYDLGADDYMTKPFSAKELYVRLKRIIASHKEGSVISVGEITYNPETMVLKRQDNEIKLSGLERKIFHYLVLNKNMVVKRDSLLERIWEWTGNDVDDHTVTVYIKRIREKTGDGVITTIKGIGYRIDG